MNKQKGFAPILIIILIALGVGVYLLYQLFFVYQLFFDPDFVEFGPQVALYKSNNCADINSSLVSEGSCTLIWRTWSMNIKHPKTLDEIVEDAANTKNNPNIFQRLPVLSGYPVKSSDWECSNSGITSTAKINGRLITDNSTEVTKPGIVYKCWPIKSSISQLSDESSGSVETANPDLIGANWKTYTNKNLGFELKYPDSLYQALEEKERVNFGSTRGVPIPYLIIMKKDFIDYKSLLLRKCLKYQGLNVEFCIEKGSDWNQEKDIDDIQLDKIDAKSFYISDFTCKYHVVQTIKPPLIELRMCVSREFSDDVFNQILSTFRFD